MSRMKTDWHKAIHSVRFTVWLYFMIFIASILAIMWIAFVFSLQKTYRVQSTSTILETAEYIYSHFTDSELTTTKLDDIAYSNSMCIIIEDKYYRTMYSYDMMANKCLIHGLSSYENRALIRKRACESDEGFYYNELKNLKFNTKMLCYAMVIGDRNDPEGYVYMNMTLEPLKFTSGIIRSQMIQVSVAVLIIGLGVSYFLSKLIATPIIRITRSAQKMGQGDYDTNFNGRGYTETERLAETLNFASKEISKVDHLQRDIIANVSHDLRTPLTMVKAYAEMIRDLSGDNPEKRNSHLKIIIDESDRLAALVNDILDLSKLQNGTASLSLSEFCMNDRIEQIMQRYNVLSEQKGYNFWVSTGRRVTVKADPIKMDQVIYNLVNNAVNYSGESRDIYVMQIQKENKIRICITDNGAGIEKDLMPLIFDRYYRAEKNKRDVIGTGLGLSIVKQVLIRHGFKFGVQSEIGTGSTFWFEMDVVGDEYEKHEIEEIN